MVNIDRGLKIGLIVLELIRDDEELQDLPVAVGTFTNRRENGLTFRVSKTDRAFTFCIYEHRNSDSIIINGKKGYNTASGDLPYMKDSAFGYMASFSAGQYQECTDRLIEMIKKFYNK